LLYPHLFLVDHYESVEDDTQRQSGNRVEVYRVFAYFNEIALAQPLLDFLPVFYHVFLGNRDHRRVPKLLNRPQI
jgi:hypothetical protein